MARQKVDPDFKKNITKVRKTIGYLNEKDANEAETRTCIYDIFKMIGYTPLTNITQELAIAGTGDDERCDLALRCDDKEPPKILVEVKRVSSDLSSRHLKQVKSYALNKGSEWAILTNGKDWQLYHISYDQPPELTMIHSWNILNDEIYILAEKFDLVCLKSIKKGILEQEWKIRNALTAHNLLKAILSEDSITSIRRNLKQISSVFVSRDDVIQSIKRLLNENALSELANKDTERKKSLPRKPSNK
ncbi:MAG: type I restriction enzyme HsdR N-terminal domain-containing protein [Dehalococcoidales bacterium]